MRTGNLFEVRLPKSLNFGDVPSGLVVHRLEHDDVRGNVLHRQVRRIGVLAVGCDYAGRLIVEDPLEVIQFVSTESS